MPLLPQFLLRPTRPLRRWDADLVLDRRRGSFDSWRRAQGLRCAELAARLDVHTTTAWAWCVDRGNPRALVPSRKRMDKIVALTGGAVQPASFYPTTSAEGVAA